MSRRAALLLWAATLPATAGDLPAIVAIEFQGNGVTRPEVMLREMVVRVGDPADAGAIERSRQAIQDLGLFSAVAVEQHPVADGVKLVVTVVERWFVLPAPRFDANTEGETAYGATVRWHNVSGRNDTLRTNYAEHQLKDENKASSTTYRASYSIPFVLGSPFGFGIEGAHSRAPITDLLDYVETVDEASVSLRRSFADGPASRGWSATTGLAWKRQDTAGADAPAPYGQATAVTFGVHFGDVRDLIFSSRGVTYGMHVATATEGVASDYDYVDARLRYARYLALGETPHQSLHFLANVNSYHGGPRGVESSTGAYRLGGPGGLRGYPGSFLIGDFSYLLAAEYARPVVWDWLRVLVVGEVGNVFSDVHDASLDKAYASIGVGLRIRVTFLVNAELEAGIAWPVSGRDRTRAFASKL